MRHKVVSMLVHGGEDRGSRGGGVERIGACHVSACGAGEAKRAPATWRAHAMIHTFPLLLAVSSVSRILVTFIVKNHTCIGTVPVKLLSSVKNSKLYCRMNHFADVTLPFGVALCNRLGVVSANCPIFVPLALPAASRRRRFVPAGVNRRRTTTPAELRRRRGSRDGRR
jgi:hypothetical protein